jgi:hypothetical protein
MPSERREVELCLLALVRFSPAAEGGDWAADLGYV